MKISEFEAQLKELDPKFEIMTHPGNPELAGVYYDRNDVNKTGFIITVPSEEIHEEYNSAFADSTGHSHNWAAKVRGVCLQHIDRLANMPGYKEDFYAALPPSKKL